MTDDHRRIKELENENAKLRASVEALQEKLRSYVPMLKQWGESLITPEELDRLITRNEWVGFDEIMQVVQKATAED